MKTVKPGGLLVLGEPFKLKEPDAAYVQVEPDFALGMVTHAENVSIAQQAGLTLLYAIVGNQDDWDRYEGLRLACRRAVCRRTLRRPRRTGDTGAPACQIQHVPELGARTVNWGIYVFRAP
jgi:hypothetical protein